jgi:hypothetical protein
MIILQTCGDEDVILPRCSNIGYTENTNNPYFQNHRAHVTWGKRNF